jgi:SAM-dependent methyltransferase
MSALRPWRRIRELERRLARTERQLAKRDRQLTRLDRDLRKQAPLLPYLISMAGLRRDHTVLDVGCGRGLLARELVAFLSDGGAYEGIEVQRKYVDDLRAQFARAPHFRFHHADLVNSAYNPEGRESSVSYRFPIEDASVDVVVLRSVFTHMLPAEVEHYMGEIARVLAPGGTSYITYFLLNDASRAEIAARDPHPLIRSDHGDYAVRSDEDPAWATALDEGLVRALYERNGLRIAEPIRHGTWPVRHRFPLGQDIVIAERPSPSR